MVAVHPLNRSVEIPHYTAHEFFAPSLLKRLSTYALAQQANFVLSQNERNRQVSELRELGELRSELAQIIQRAAPEMAQRCGLASFTIGLVELALVCMGGSGYQTAQRDADANGTRRLSFVYFCHKEPQAFNGGTLHLYDETRESECVIEPVQNSVTFFPSTTLFEVRRVGIPTPQWVNSRLTLNGWAHTPA